MVAGLSTARGTNFARRFDAFSYKRLTDFTDMTNPSTLGAILSLVGFTVLVVLVLAETAAFIVPTLHQDVLMASDSVDSPVKISFNVSFPSFPCHLLSLDISDILGLHATNISDASIRKYKLDANTGRALLVQGEKAPNSLKYDNVVKGSESQVSTQLNKHNFADFIKSSNVALVAYGAAWCPWTRYLAPVWEEVASVVSKVEDVKLGKVECTDREAAPLCQQAHIAAFPTIMLYKAGSVHSHTHYHGDRTAQALLNFLVMARQDDSIVTDPHNGGNADPHQAVEKIARKLKLLGESMGAEHDGHGHDSEQPDVDGRIDGKDPADPGAAIGLIEAIHKAGFTAPGDAARAALGKLIGGSAKAAGEEACNDTAAGGARQLEAVAPLPKEGCMVTGSLNVKRVPGHIRFTPGAGGMTLNPDSLNMTHIIHELYFGPRVTAYQLTRLPAGTERELHRLRSTRFISPLSNVSHEHYINVVGSTFRFATGHTVDTFRYTANSHSFEDRRAVAATQGGDALAGTAVDGDDSVRGTRDETTLPSVRFSYELSPVAIVVSEVHKPTYQFVTSLCAIVGGVFTVIGLLDSLLHNSLSSMRYKQGINKNG